MKSRALLYIGLATILIFALIVVVALALTPQETNPAYAAAVAFVDSAAKGDDATALNLLDAPMQAYVAANCAGGEPSGCIQSYTPPEWGKLLSAVYRRAAPDGAAWNVEVIANYEQGTGASGVCSLIHVTKDAGGKWQVSGWAGFVHCGEPESRNMDANPDTPNRAP